MSLPLTVPWTTLQDWSSTMKGWLGSDWQATVLAWLITKPLSILFLVAVAWAVRWSLHRLIDRLVKRAVAGMPTPMLKRGNAEKRLPKPVAAGRRVQRSETMGSLLKSVASIVIFAVTGVTVIAQAGYPIGPLLASSAVLGVAFGLGAQNLVKDFLAGIFILFEDQCGVGDVVDLGEASGTVESVGLRITRLRDVEGTVWYVRNGQIIRIGNSSQNWARTVVDVPVPLNADLEQVKKVLTEVARELWDDDDFKGRILEEPEVPGVQTLTPDWITVRVTLKTAPLEQWAIAREMRQRIKARFDAHGIEFAGPPRSPRTAHHR